jgi:3-oxoacyl-[acyl-carrier protein] reductase
VVVITGAGYGIGRAYALAMAEEGASVAAADIDMASAEDTVKKIQANGGKALALRTDVSSPESTLGMAKKTLEQFGRIDVLVNNAAILGKLKVARVPFFELEIDEWDRVIAVNLKGTFLCCRAVFPQMKAQGGGKIINVSTPGFFFGHANYVHYVASKGGVVGLTRAMARELGAYNINVNCVAPGATLSDDPGVSGYEARKDRLQKTAVQDRCLKRMEYPADLVGTVIFLASSDSDFVTGQTIIVDGGAVMH